MEAKKGPGMEASGCNVRAYTTHEAQYRANVDGSTTRNHVESGIAEIAPVRPAITLYEVGRGGKMKTEYAKLGMNLACEDEEKKRNRMQVR
jgi:hypothetical protein